MVSKDCSPSRLHLKTICTKVRQNMCASFDFIYLKLQGCNLHKGYAVLNLQLETMCYIMLLWYTST